MRCQSVIPQLQSSMKGNTSKRALHLCMPIMLQRAGAEPHAGRELTKQHLTKCAGCLGNTAGGSNRTVPDTRNYSWLHLRSDLGSCF